MWWHLRKHFGWQEVAALAPAGFAVVALSIEVFCSRCEARAFLVAAGELDLIQAVDELQAAAIEDGLVAEIGQDAVQAIMANAFDCAPSTERLTAGDAPGWQQAAMIWYHSKDGRNGRVSLVELDAAQVERFQRRLTAPSWPSAGPSGTAESVLDASAWLFFQVKRTRSGGGSGSRSTASRSAPKCLEHLPKCIEQRRSKIDDRSAA